MNEKNDLSFETAFKRLEEILDLMNEGKLPLDQSLNLFKEADDLIKKCDDYLSSSEKKIETLIKNRSNELKLDEKQNPITAPFIPEDQQVLSEQTPSM